MPASRALSAIERQKRIIERLEERGAVQIDELVKALGVSKMTVHRDLDTLEVEKRLRKVHGGAAPVTVSPATAEQCYYCHSLIAADSHTKVILHLADGAHRLACCPHCGLLALTGASDAVASALVTDFLYGRMISARAGSYVIGADIRLCCAPAALAFEDSADAARFQRGFGGQVCDLDSAIATIRASIALSPHGHARH